MGDIRKDDLMQTLSAGVMGRVAKLIAEHEALGLPCAVRTEQHVSPRQPVEDREVFAPWQGGCCLGT